MKRPQYRLLFDWARYEPALREGLPLKRMQRARRVATRMLDTGKQTIGYEQYGEQLVLFGDCNRLGHTLRRTREIVPLVQDVA